MKSQEAKLQNYLDNIKEEAKDHVIKELFLHGEMGKQTITEMIENFDKMYVLPDEE